VSPAPKSKDKSDEAPVATTAAASAETNPNVERVRAVYDALRRSDVGEATNDWSDSFIWEGPKSRRLPGAGRQKGKTAAVAALEASLAAWDELKLAVDELIDAGDTVVALGHLEASISATVVKQEFAHVWRFQDARPARIQLFYDTLESADALELI
jgi:ketosteroid isomerase-like protein